MAGPTKPDYGPTGCCQPLALLFAVVVAAVVSGLVFLAVQIVGWIA